MHYVMTAVFFFVSVCASVSVAGEEPSTPQIEPGKVRTQPTELPKPKGLVLTPETYPRTSGSTSAEPLGVWVACRLLNKECRWPGATWGERRLYPLKSNAANNKNLMDIDDTLLKIRHYGTHGSYKNLITGQADLIYECRLPSEDERNLMQSHKVELDIRPVALDAFVFLRNRENPVTDLTLAQVRDIYTPGRDGKGMIANWNRVGGPDTEIHAYVRNRNSGSQETMQSLVMKERPILTGRSMTGMTMMGPFNHLLDDKSGIGFSFYYYQRHMAPRSDKPFPRVVKQMDKEPVAAYVDMFAINGVMPSRATIANRTYPLVTDVYVVTRKDLKADHPAAKLRDWLLTPEGQGIVGETGYVPR